MLILKPKGVILDREIIADAYRNYSGTLKVWVNNPSLKEGSSQYDVTQTNPSSSLVEEAAKDTELEAIFSISTSNEFFVYAERGIMVWHDGAMCDISTSSEWDTVKAMLNAISSEGALKLIEFFRKRPNNGQWAYIENGIIKFTKKDFVEKDGVFYSEEPKKKSYFSQPSVSTPHRTVQHGSLLYSNKSRHEGGHQGDESPSICYGGIEFVGINSRFLAYIKESCTSDCESASYARTLARPTQNRESGALHAFNFLTNDLIISFRYDNNTYGSCSPTPSEIVTALKSRGLEGAIFKVARMDRDGTYSKVTMITAQAPSAQPPRKIITNLESIPHNSMLNPHLDSPKKVKLTDKQRKFIIRYYTKNNTTISTPASQKRYAEELDMFTDEDLLRMDNIEKIGYEKIRN